MQEGPRGAGKEGVDDLREEAGRVPEEEFSKVEAKEEKWVHRRNLIRINQDAEV